MELSTTDFEQIKDLNGKNAIVIISNGKIKSAELPSHGTIEITTNDNKVTLIKNQTKTKF